MLSDNFDNLPSDHIPQFVVFDLEYRDGHNFKTSESYSFANDLQLTVEQIRAWADEHLDFDEILAKNYALPNLAPLDNEQDACDNDYDHCYMDVTQLDVTDKPEGIATRDQQFSTVYHAAIAQGDPDVAAARTATEQQVVLNRIDADIRALMTSFGDTNAAQVKTALAPLMEKLATFTGMRIVSDQQRVAAAEDMIVPAFLDHELLLVIVNSALNYPKARADLIAQFSEKRIVDFHSQFLSFINASSRKSN